MASSSYRGQVLVFQFPVNGGLVRSPDFVFVDDIALQLLVPSIVAVALFDNLVDREVLETGFLGQLFAVHSFAHPGRTGNYDIRLMASHGDWCSLLITMRSCVLHVLCIFCRSFRLTALAS